MQLKQALVLFGKPALQQIVWGQALLLWDVKMLFEHKGHENLPKNIRNRKYLDFKVV